MFIRSIRRFCCCSSNNFVSSNKKLSKYNLSDYFIKGSFGKLYLQNEEKPIVIKKIKRCFFFEKEYIIGKKNTFSNIIKYNDIIRDKSHVYLFMDYYINGDMLDYMEESGKLSISDTKKYTKQMLNCVNNLNSMGYIHLDIKLDNFFLDNEMNLVLGDLGCCHNILSRDDKLKMLNIMVGTKSYSPYEIFNEDYGNKSDVWSIGICVYAMLTGKMLDVNLDNIFSLKKIFLEEYSDETNDFLNKLLCPIYSKRITISDALSHPFLTSS